MNEIGLDYRRKMEGDVYSQTPFSKYRLITQIVLLLLVLDSLAKMSLIHF